MRKGKTIKFPKVNMGEYLYELKAGKKEEIGRKEQKMSLQQKQKPAKANAKPKHLC